MKKNKKKNIKNTGKDPEFFEISDMENEDAEAEPDADEGIDDASEEIPDDDESADGSEDYHEDDSDDEAEEDDSEDEAEEDDSEDEAEKDDSEDEDEAEEDDSEDEDDSGEDSEDDQDDDVDGEDFDEAEYRRELRHKRRVRSQILSYLAVFVVICILACGIYFLVNYLSGLINEHRQTEEVEAQIEAMTEEESDEGEIVISEPEIVIEEEAEEEPAEEVDYLGEYVTRVIDGMTLEDKVAQLFMISPEALTGVDTVTSAGDATQAALETYAVGGLVYSGKNITDADQITELLANTLEWSKYKPFLAVCEPGGDESSVAGSSISDIPSIDSPAVIAESGDSSQAYNAGTTIASYLTALGFNMDIAPSGDIVTADGTVSEDVSYGSDDAIVTDMVAQMISGLDSGDVWSCITGFPGEGSVTEDTADGRVESVLSMDELTASFNPYIAGISQGTSAVMVNNVTYSAADDSGMPASLSSNIIDTVLRGNLGYDGIVISGPLDEKAVTEYYTSGEAAIYALAAGADMIYEPENFSDAYTAVLEAVNDGTIPESRLDLSLERILRVKFADDYE